MTPALASAALTPDQVPGPEASSPAVLAFALTIDGYAEADGDALARLAHRWDRGDPLSLHELRLALFFKQRAHHDTGGTWGPTDPLMDAMVALVAEIRQRLARGETAAGLEVWRGDLTTLTVDAVVNAANERMLGGGGVDGAVHRAAGPDLLAACRAVPEVRPGVRCPTGEARVTPGFRLPARLVVHTVGPVWQGGAAGEDAALTAAYRAALAAADAAGAATVAFPAISTGVYGFPADRAARIAVETIRQWQAAHARPAGVVLVAFDRAAEQTLRAALRP